MQYFKKLKTEFSADEYNYIIAAVADEEAGNFISLDEAGQPKPVSNDGWEPSTYTEWFITQSEEVQAAEIAAGNKPVVPDVTPEAESTQSEEKPATDEAVAPQEAPAEEPAGEKVEGEPVVEPLPAEID